jgi:hypothetical protein
LVEKAGLFRGILIKLREFQVHSKAGGFLNGPEERKI